MTSVLFDPRVARVLDHLHAEADRVDPPLLAKAKGKHGKERAALLDEAFIPVSREAGLFLYTLLRGSQPGLAVEFGTSFGISTIYMAAAIRDRGHGKVITTELEPNKAVRAREYIADAGFADLVELREGDALTTLQGLPSTVAAVFLDGWKELYLPFLKLVEPTLLPGACVIADDLDLFPAALQSYLNYVRGPGSGYVSVTVPIGDAMELSVRAS